MTLGDMKKLVSPMPFPPDPSPPTSLHVHQFRPCKVPPTQICLLYQHHCYFSETLIVTSLPTPTSILVFLLFATHVLGLKRPGPGTQGAGHLGGGGFSLGNLIASTTPFLTEWGLPMLHFRPEFWASCQQSFLSSPWGAVVVSDDLWEFTHSKNPLESSRSA